MKPVNIIHVQHLSGRFYEAWVRFAEAHPELSFYQSPVFARLINCSPYVEGVLLLALSDDPLKDPGAGRPHFLTKRPSANKKQDAKEAFESKKEPIVDKENILASILALMISEEEPQGGIWKIFRRWHKKLTTCTLVYDGPLLAPGTRLQQERAIKALLEALHRHVNKRSPSTQLVKNNQLTDFLPLFRELGYKRIKTGILPVVEHQEKIKHPGSEREMQMPVCLKRGWLKISMSAMKQPGYDYLVMNDLKPGEGSIGSNPVCFHRKNRFFSYYLASIVKRHCK